MIRGDEMKKFILAIGMVFLLCVNAQAAPFLACDWPTEAAQIGSTEVEVNGVVRPGTFTQSGVNALLLDLTGFPNGQVTFRARFISLGGWPSDWSSPFADGKPGAPGGVRVVP